MPSLLTVGVAGVALLATLVQLLVPHLAYGVVLGLGLGKTFQWIEEFPAYSCRRVAGRPGLEACEDMWLSEGTRTLFAACSDPLARISWMPNVAALNASGRSMTDAILAIDVDSVKGDDFTYRALKTPGFAGTNGDGRLHLVGLTGADGSENADADVSLYMVNAKPSVDAATGELLDNAVVGANQTVELFRVRNGADEMQHVRTFADGAIATPNNVALWSEDGKGETFFVSNDHGSFKVGLQHHLSPFSGTGDVTLCRSTAASTECTKAATGLAFPNGLVAARGLLYVPSSMAGGVRVYRAGPGPAPAALELVAEVAIPYAIDNLSVDGNGDVWAAAFPVGKRVLDAQADPLRSGDMGIPSAVIRLRRVGAAEDRFEFEWEKVLEDGEGKVLPVTTTAVHDVKTGRLFLSGIISPFITICDKV